jgi:hypothetical protein
VPGKQPYTTWIVQFTWLALSRVGASGHPAPLTPTGRHITIAGGRRQRVSVLFITILAQSLTATFTYINTEHIGVIEVRT